MILSWFKNRRRKKILAQPWPDDWSLHLNRNVRLSWNLSDAEVKKLRQLVQVFFAEKNWEGCDGLQLTEEMQVTIAAQACLMLLGVSGFHFDNVQTLLIYPEVFERKLSEGPVHNLAQYRSGEAWQGGPIVLSWRDALSGGRDPDDGRNVVIHEFAHALDGLDGEMGGSPIFDTPELSHQWEIVMEREFASLCQSRDMGYASLLDYYGATNHAEFFAVSVETFFEKPHAMKRAHAEMFQLLQGYFKVDPSRWQATPPQ